MKKLENIYEHEGVLYKRVEAEDKIRPCKTCCFHRDVDDDRDASCLLSLSEDFLCDFDDSAVYVQAQSPTIITPHVYHSETITRAARRAVELPIHKLRKKITLRRRYGRRISS